MASALFGNISSRGSSNKNLVEFKAGRMYMKMIKGKNMVHPDKRKGMLYIYQSDDSLMHLCWKDRSKGSVDDDLIIFPDDTEFKRVSQCTTGRVYLLKFKTSSRKFFFWMQEPKTDKDVEYCTKVNNLLNNPPPLSTSRNSSNGSGNAGTALNSLPSEISAGLGDSELQNLLGNMSQQQLMQLIGGMGMSGMSSLIGGGTGRSSTSTLSDTSTSSRTQVSTPDTQEATPKPAKETSPPESTQPSEESKKTDSSSDKKTTPSSSSAIQLTDLQNILSGIAVEKPPKDAIDLSKAITPDAMIPILANPDVQQKLIKFLPEGESLPKTEQELRGTIQSPQFQQAMSSFSAALASGQLGPLMQQFDLGDEVSNAAAAGDTEAFVKAMQKIEKSKEKDDES